MELNFNDESVQARLRWNIFGIFAVRLLTITTAGLLTPILVLYVTGKNVADSRFLLLQAAFHLTALTLDAPFGYLADRYGRKRFISAGAALLTGGALCYAFSVELSGFLIAEILFAIGQAAIFGAEQALLRDTLERLGRTMDFQKLWGYVLSLEMGASAATTVASGYLFAWDKKAPFIAEAVLYGVLFLLSFKLYEAPRSSLQERIAPSFVLRLCFRENTWIRWMLLASAGWSAILITVLWCQSKLLMAHGISEKDLGIWFALLSIFAGASGIAVSRHSRVDSPFGLCLKLILILAVSLLIIGIAPLNRSGTAAAISGLAALQLVRSVSRILFAGWLKEEIPSEFHATGSSINMAMSRLAYVVLALCVFPFIDAFDARQKFVLLGVIAFAIGAALLATFPAKKRKGSLVQQPSRIARILS